MDVSEKLVELLNEVQETGLNEIPAGFGCTREYIKNEKIASHLIAHGVTVQEWHSASEPPKSVGKIQKILVCRSQPSATCGNVSIDSEFFIDKFAPPNNVTHWCAMPKPPKGE